MTRKLSLEATAREQLEAARRNSAHRAASTVHGGHEQTMRQTVVALTAGAELGEHENPGEATVYVISGRVRLTAGAEEWEARAGDLLLVPPERHSLAAIDDAAVLLTAVPRAHSRDD
jgi:quercetin dioxygenase-like cupin family protein